MAISNQQGYENLIQQILQTAGKIFRELRPVVPSEWLTSDLTVAQLRVLLVLHAEGPGRMSTIAANLDIAISTATGIVEKLVNKNLVERSNDPEDRRLVICKLSAEGELLMNRLWALGEKQIERLVRGLTPDQLDKSAEVAGFLLSHIKAKSTVSEDS